MPSDTPSLTIAAPRNFHAALLALVSTAILSFVDNFVQPVSQEAGLWQFHVFRTLIAVPLLLIWATVFGFNFRPRTPRFLILRSVTVGIGLMIYFASLGVLPVAQAGAGIFSAPIWVLLFSALIFANRITFFQFLAVVCGFAGVLMLLQPDLANLTALSFLPLAAGAFYALGTLITRHLCGAENALTLTLGIFTTMGAASAVILLCVTLWPNESQGFVTRGWETPTARFLYLTLIQAVGAMIAVSCIAQAYRIGTPSFIAVFEYSFLVFASLWSYLLWGTTTNTLALAGIAVIFASAITLSLMKRAEVP
ncbi:EamA-like transporter family protein [Roseovarius litorisediminis]|uniref:EamA-like transporter family protein n=1 Tax=Roseovarius litorisediminis TaxID=1312363 RepID=A0A1Y5T2M4_9RHOB|nr:DMT family transporter [Roseovarius litorisediminis]SLN54186.1 EamA-like transporter family protein [Roseovarius litorisediminis]